MNNINEIKLKIDSNNQSIVNNDDINDMKNDTNDMKNDTNDVKNDINDMKNDINDVKNDINDMKNDINDVNKYNCSVYNKKNKKLRRELAHQEYVKHRKRKRKEEKERRKATKRKKLEELESLKIQWKNEGLNDSEVLQKEILWRKNTPGMYRQKQRPREDISKDIANAVSVAIDLQYDKLGTDKEVTSLSSQINYCYGANMKSMNPFKLILTSFKENSQIYAKMMRHKGFKNWLIDTTTNSISEYFDTSSIVYLSSEADEVLKTLEQDKVYVIGGIVDRNRLKGLTAKTSKEMNVKSVRLPLKEFVEFSSRSVLTVNVVYELLLKFNETGSWIKAIEHALPRRKNFKLIK